MKFRDQRKDPPHGKEEVHRQGKEGPLSGPQVERSTTLVLERSGLLFRARLTGEDGVEHVTPWRERSSAMYAEVYEQWQKWHQALFDGMGLRPVAASASRREQ